VDHKPTNKEESRRIKKAGGAVRKDIDDVFYRVYHKNKKYPGLNMSRSIGDLLAQAVGVSSEPEISTFDLERKH
jgi:hypothetical protein